MLKKTVLLIIISTSFLTQKVTTNPSTSFVSGMLSESPRKPLVMVIVNSSIYPAIESSLNQYAVDVENAGFSVNITETNQLSDKTPKGIRAYLRRAMNQDLVGAFFVGDVPEAWYEVDAKNFPTDMYYRDLDGLWTDLDGDEVYDEHSGDMLPEIWVGRLKASTISGGEASLINNYFTKNHRYRNGLRILPWWRTLAYIDDDGIGWTEEAQLSLSQISTNITLVTDPATTNARDYKSRLKDPFGYQWVYLMSHGDFDYHTFIIPQEQGQRGDGRTVYSWQYRSIDPRVFFYLFFVCSAARYTESEYLAGSAIFTDTYGLLSIGSTHSMFSISFREFFTSLSEGEAIGVAFQEWSLEQFGKCDQPWEKQDYQIMFYGLSMVGDPTLQPYRRRSVMLHDISITDVTTRLRNATNERSLSIVVAIENRGNFSETFDFTIRCGIVTAFYRLSLTAKANTTVTFTVTEPYRVTFVDSCKTMIEARATIVPEEFNAGDNVIHVYVEDVVIIPPEGFSSYLMIFPIVIFVIIPFVFLKMLMSERPLLLRYWMRIRRYFAKKRWI